MHTAIIDGTRYAAETPDMLSRAEALAAGVRYDASGCTPKGVQSTLAEIGVVPAREYVHSYPDTGHFPMGVAEWIARVRRGEFSVREAAHLLWGRITERGTCTPREDVCPGCLHVGLDSDVDGRIRCGRCDSCWSHIRPAELARLAGVATDNRRREREAATWIAIYVPEARP